MSDRVRVGLALGYDPTASVAQMATAAAAAEGRGFEMVFFSETLFSNRDSVSALAAFALATRRIALGATQVVRLRSPLLMAQTAASLDELSDGRLVLALGAFTAMHAAKNGVELTDPLPTLREYVLCIRRLLAGESVTYHGETVHMDDAVLAFNTSIDDDLPRALEAVRWEIASKFRYPRTPKFKLLVGEPHIDPADLPLFAAAYRDGGTAALAAAVPDSYVAGMSAAGTLDTVRARILAYRRAGVTLPLLRPAAAAQTERLLAAFGAGSGARG